MVGSGNFIMQGARISHDVTIGNNCIIGNGSQEWNGKCFCPEVKAPQTQPGIPLKQLNVGLYTCGCRFSCGAVLPGQAFEFWKASNNNFSKRYRVVHTRSDLSVRRPCIAVLHPASIEVSPNRENFII